MNNNIKYLYNFLNNKYSTILLLIFILFYKNGFSSIFNGLPFSNKYETILFLIVFPIIILFNSKIFLDKKFRNIILVLFLLKIILNSSQFTNGLSHKIYKDEERNSEIVKSYSSFWFNDISDIQESNWLIKKNFPLDWMNYDKSFGIPGGKTVASTEKYKKIKLNDQVETYLIINEKKEINFSFEGLALNSFLDLDNNDNNSKRFLLNNGNNNIYFEKGIYHLKFNLNYEGEKWAFNISGTNNFFELSDFRYFTIDKPKLPLNILLLLILIGIAYEISVIFLILYSLFFTLKNIINLKNLFLLISSPISIFASIYIIRSIKIDDQTSFWTLSLSFIFLFIIYFFNTRLKLNKNEGDLIFLSIFLTTSFYCLTIFYESFDTTFFWTAGDDWMIFHEYARKIVVEKEWIRAGEDVYYYRPGIRYIFAIFHIIFGNPSFAIQFIDVWSILLITYLIFLILHRTSISIRTSLALSIIFPIMIFGESFRWLIGRGLTEFFGSFIIILCSYLIYKINLKINIRFLSICILVILTAWLREEKFLAGVCVILLSNHFKIKFNFIRDVFDFIINNYKLIILYSFLILIGFPILFIIRNYIYSENLTALDNPVFLKFGYKSIYTIIMGVNHNEYPRLIALINIPAIVISIIILINYKFYRYFNNIGFPIIVLMLTLPTLIFEIPGYIPRHSIYLLPYAIIINSIFVIKLYNSFYKNN